MVLFKKEKKVVELVLRHIDKVELCLSTAIRSVEAYFQENMDEAKSLSKQVSNLETEADNLRLEILDKLYLGAYLPLLREDIYRLTERIDKVANAGEACCRFFLNQRPSFPDDLKSRFIEVSKASLGIAGSLKLAVQCFFKGECNVSVVREHTKEVGDIETEVDKMEWDLTKAIFTSALEFSNKLHLKSCLDSIVEVADRAEDTSDHLEFAAMKSMV